MPVERSSQSSGLPPNAAAASVIPPPWTIGAVMRPAAMSIRCMKEPATCPRCSPAGPSGVPAASAVANSLSASPSDRIVA